MFENIVYWSIESEIKRISEHQVKISVRLGTQILSEKINLFIKAKLRITHLFSFSTFVVWKFSIFYSIFAWLIVPVISTSSVSSLQKMWFDNYPFYRQLKGSRKWMNNSYSTCYCCTTINNEEKLRKYETKYW